MIELLNIDCMEHMRLLPDKVYDLAIVDPPYFEGPNKRGFYGNAKPTADGGRKVRRVEYAKTDNWEVPGPEYFEELRRVSRNQIIWGANHFAQAIRKDSPAWIVWDKCNGSSDYADAELAWTSFDRAVRLYAFMWNGMLQGSPENGRKMQGNKSLNEKRVHPTQKPVALYRWLLKNYAKPGDRILDTHGGSMASGIACAMEGFDATICEIDPAHFDNGAKRVRDAEAAIAAQPKLFNPPTPATQLQIDHES